MTCCWRSVPSLTLRRSNSGSFRKKSQLSRSCSAQRRLRTHVDGLELGLGLVAGPGRRPRRARSRCNPRPPPAGVHFIPFHSGARASVALKPCGAPASSFGVVDLRADGGVRADGHALHALDADRLVPHRDVQRQVALLVLRRGGRERAVARKTRSPAGRRPGRPRACPARRARTPARWASPAAGNRPCR